MDLAVEITGNPVEVLPTGLPMFLVIMVLAGVYLESAKCLIRLDLEVDVF